MDICVADLLQQNAVIHILEVVLVLMERAVEQRCQAFLFSLFAVFRHKQVKSVMFAITLVYFGFLVFCDSYLLSRLKGNRRLSAIGNALVGVFFIGFAARLASTTS